MIDQLIPSVLRYTSEEPDGRKAMLPSGFCQMRVTLPGVTGSVRDVHEDVKPVALVYAVVELFQYHNKPPTK